MSTESVPAERVLRLVRLDADDTALLATGAAVVIHEAAIFRVEGPGAVACMQGICTNDLQKRGQDTICYGALLTPKGMIILDGWFLRDGDTITLVTDRAAREAVLGIFRKTLPPRLARVTDQSESHRWISLVGAAASATAPRAGWPTTAGTLHREGEFLLATPPATAPFGACAVVPAEAASDIAARSGLGIGTTELADAARILAGFPALGAEIDEKTLPQEVRFDEHAGVSYDKGCYTGQETVARLHFRGHPNRELRHLEFAEALTQPPSERSIIHGEKSVGTLRSLLLRPGYNALGLAPVRREVEIGATVEVAGLTATVQTPPAKP